MAKKKVKKVKKKKAKVRSVKEVKKPEKEVKIEESAARPTQPPVKISPSTPVVVERETPSAEPVPGVSETVPRKNYSSGATYTPAGETKTARVYRQTMQQADAQLRELQRRQRLQASEEVFVSQETAADTLRMSNLQRAQRMVAPHRAADLVETSESLEKQYDIRSTVYKAREKQRRERT